MKLKWKAFIEVMTDAPPDKWRAITARVAWAYRKGFAESPDPVSDWLELLPEREEWESLRKEINRRRRNKAERKKYKPITERRAADNRRREYMRSYMSQYRQRKKNKPGELGLDG